MVKEEDGSLFSWRPPGRLRGVTEPVPLVKGTLNNERLHMLQGWMGAAHVASRLHTHSLTSCCSTTQREEQWERRKRVHQSGQTHSLWSHVAETTSPDEAQHLHCQTRRMCLKDVLAADGSYFIAENRCMNGSANQPQSMASVHRTQINANACLLLKEEKHTWMKRLLKSALWRKVLPLTNNPLMFPHVLPLDDIYSILTGCCLILNH